MACIPTLLAEFTTSHELSGKSTFTRWNPPNIGFKYRSWFPETKKQLRVIIETVERKCYNFFKGGVDKHLKTLIAVTTLAKRSHTHCRVIDKLKEKSYISSFENLPPCKPSTLNLYIFYNRLFGFDIIFNIACFQAGPLFKTFSFLAIMAWTWQRFRYLEIRSWVTYWWRCLWLLHF